MIEKILPTLGQERQEKECSAQWELESWRGPTQKELQSLRDADGQECGVSVDRRGKEDVSMHPYLFLSLSLYYFLLTLLQSPAKKNWHEDEEPKENNQELFKLINILRYQSMANTYCKLFQIIILEHLHINFLKK